MSSFAAPAVPRCGPLATGYPMPVVNKARTLRAGGWSLRRVAMWVAEETGRKPSSSTVLRWTDPKNAAHKARHDRDRRRAYSARGAAAGGRLGSAHHTPEFRLARMRALRARRLSIRVIADLMTFDYGKPISPAQVKSALTAGRYPTRAPRA